jgi:hypothetical protein
MVSSFRPRPQYPRLPLRGGLGRLHGRAGRFRTEKSLLPIKPVAQSGTDSGYFMGPSASLYLNSDYRKSTVFNDELKR